MRQNLPDVRSALVHACQRADANIELRHAGRLAAPRANSSWAVLLTGSLASRATGNSAQPYSSLRLARGYNMTMARFWIFALCLAAAGQAPAAPATVPSTRPASTAVVIPIRGQINDQSRDGFFRRLDRAKAMGAQAIIIELDTPGGALGPTFDITRTIRGLDIRTIAFVNPRAYSAGSMIAVACNQIVMSGGAMIGDCAAHPDQRAPGASTAARGRASQDRQPRSGRLLRQRPQEPLPAAAHGGPGPARSRRVPAGECQGRVSGRRRSRLQAAGRWRPVETHAQCPAAGG